MTAPTGGNGDTAGSYPGGKGLLYQRLISLIPPHAVYVAPFAGFDAVARFKRPARENILIDLDREALDNLRSTLAGNGESEARSAAIATNSEATRWEFLNADGIAWLDRRAPILRADCFVYCDPPYLRETRKQARALYRYEMSAAQHRRLLAIIRGLRCPVMISGYYSDLYVEALRGWPTATFETTTRGGSPATEWVWMNYPAPVALHDYRYLGDGFRERERIKRKKRRWTNKLRTMPLLEKQAILAAIAEMEKDQ